MNLLQWRGLFCQVRGVIPGLRWACFQAAVASCALAVLAVSFVPSVHAAKAKRVGSTYRVPITARTIDAFHRIGVGSQVYGSLQFVGGLVLTSPWDGFGGWSDVTVDRDGRRFLAVSDDGHWLKGDITYRGVKPTGVQGAVRGELQALSGRVLKRKRERDAEGVTLLAGSIDNGSLLISFERIHRIGRFKINGSGVMGPVRYLKLPREARGLWTNKGIESVGVLRGGRFKGAIVAVAERRRGAKGGANRPGWILHKGKSYRFYVKDRGNMDVTSVAGLPNGDVILLERRFRWSEGISMRLRRVKARDLRPGATVDGEVLLNVGLDYEIDNMEGLAVHQGEDGASILTLISDDNFNKVLQRTLLLQFRLHDPQVRARPASR